MHLLKTENLSKSYNRRKDVDAVSIAVGKGEIVGLLGPNGAGKTTTFYSVVGIVRPDGGKVIFDDRDISNMPMYKRARLGLGYLSQEPSIFRRLTVAENIMAILETLNLSREERKRRLAELLAELKNSYLAKNKAYTLSGGERRTLVITKKLGT